MVSLWNCQFEPAQFAGVTTFQFSKHFLIITLKVSILKIDIFKVKIDTFKIKIEKCLENEKNAKLLHVWIGPAKLTVSLWGRLVQDQLNYNHSVLYETVSRWDDLKTRSLLGYLTQVWCMFHGENISYKNLC